MTVHRYRAGVSWNGSTGTGYDRYDRRHTGWAGPARVEVALTADPAFRGDASGINPEQLVVMAASSCQMLTFLAMAARAGLDVVGYEDGAEAVMPDDDPPVRLTEIALRPRVTVAAGSDLERVAHLVEVAHRHCYVANSLTTRVTLDPRIDVAGQQSAS